MSAPEPPPVDHHASAEALVTAIETGAADWEPLAAAGQIRATLALVGELAIIADQIAAFLALLRKWEDS